MGCAIRMPGSLNWQCHQFRHDELIQQFPVVVLVLKDSQREKDISYFNQDSAQERRRRSFACREKTTPTRRGNGDVKESSDFFYQECSSSSTHTRNRFLDEITRFRIVYIKWVGPGNEEEQVLTRKTFW